MYPNWVDERDVTRFWSKVTKASSLRPLPTWDGRKLHGRCWRWDGGTRPSSAMVHYGRFKCGGRDLLAHRVSYELLVGEIPDGLTIDHLCRNTLCMNPKHMELVPLAENVRRARLFGIPPTYCKHGHQFTDENTITNVRGHRECRACHRARASGRDPRVETVGRDRRRESPAPRGPAARNAAKTHCKRGHPLSGDNVRVNDKGHRKCVECNRVAAREYARRKAAESRA